MSDWFYAINNQQQGPISEEALKKMLVAHQLPSDTLVWNEGMESWVPANSVAALMSSQPPPLSKATFSSANNPSAGVPLESSSPSSATSPRITTNKVTDNAGEIALAAIAYISILFIISLLAAKDSPFVRFHANQGLTLFLASLAIGLGLYVLSPILVHLPIIGFFAGIVFLLFYLLPFVLMVIGIINAIKGQMKPLPLIGQYTLLK